MAFERGEHLKRVAPESSPKGKISITNQYPLKWVRHGARMKLIAVDQ